VSSLYGMGEIGRAILIDRVHDVLARQAPLVRVGADRVINLGSDDDLVASRAKILQGLDRRGQQRLAVLRLCRGEAPA